jgi:hypothetical protein
MLISVLGKGAQILGIEHVKSIIIILTNIGSRFLACIDKW